MNTIIDRHKYSLKNQEQGEPAFGGYMVASAPLLWTNSAWTIRDEDSWRSNSFNTISGGRREGSYFFSFYELARSGFDSRGTSFGAVSGNIDNGGGLVISHRGYNDWYLGYSSEWSTIMGTTRKGAKVNGSAGKHYAMVNKGGTPIRLGIILFPDNYTVVGKSLVCDTIDGATVAANNDISESEIDEYVNQGCEFLPGWGYQSGYDWYGNYVYLWTATSYNNNLAYAVQARCYGMSPYTYEYKLWQNNKNSNYFLVRLIRKI